jgi:hypothetical protein
MKRTFSPEDFVDAVLDQSLKDDIHFRIGIDIYAIELRQQHRVELSPDHLISSTIDLIVSFHMPYRKLCNPTQIVFKATLLTRDLNSNKNNNNNKIRKYLVHDFTKPYVFDHVNFELYKDGCLFKEFVLKVSTLDQRIQTKIWKLWDDATTTTFHSYLYWIPEELLEDIMETFFTSCNFPIEII